ncbi:hypothetical protein [Pseudovibrio sp. POLY-S9]|uniref:hypothetical protein n=1 Tax=Pseudovibrio sp. POLY-S9 TaxID=1576596 RepID=UPI00128ECC55|nr:hypothetical protein [Pseudovibrio sp. POLY-S9]
MNIPKTVFESLVKWMAKGPWPEHLQEVLHEHFHAYCDLYNIDEFDELADQIGPHWFNSLWAAAFEDFLSRDTEDGNVIETYLKRRGWRETPMTKAFMQSMRTSAMSLYEVSDILPGESFLARDLLRGGEPIRVEEKTATQTLAPWQHIATRLVTVRDQSIIAGCLLPFGPEISANLVEAFHELAENAEMGVEEMFDHTGEPADDQKIQDTAHKVALSMMAPVISEIFLLDVLSGSAAGDIPQLYNSDDEEIEFCVLHYPITKGVTQTQIQAILAEAGDMEPATQKFWNWFETVKPAGKKRRNPTNGKQLQSQLTDGRTVLGSLEFKGRKLEAQVNSVERASRLKARLQELLGDMVREPLTERMTVEQALADHQCDTGAHDPLNLSPQEEAEIHKAFMDQHYRETLDQPIPMLDDKTPRQAARTKKGKDKVAAWIKYLERQTTSGSNKDLGEPYDFLWMWEELGVADLRK